MCYLYINMILDTSLQIRIYTVSLLQSGYLPASWFWFVLLHHRLLQQQKLHLFVSSPSCGYKPR